MERQPGCVRLSVLLLSIILAHCLSFSFAAGQSPPNIVVIMVDDLDSLSLKFLLATDLMPNLKRYLVDQGVEFTESFVSCSTCCPSRATYLSGRYAHNHKVYSNTVLTNGAVVTFDDSNTLATWLQSAGYRTAHIGRYLNGYGLFSKDMDDPELLQRVRDYWNERDPKGARRMEWTYIPPGWSSWFGLLDPSAFCTYGYLMNANGSVLHFKKDGSILRDGSVISPGFNDGGPYNYQTDILTHFSLQFVDHAERTDDQQPFFLSIMPVAPHHEICGEYDPDGPQGQHDSYSELFANYIRPAPRHQHFVGPLTELGRTKLPLIPSFDESDLRDKPAELQGQLAPLAPEGRENVFRQFGHRLASMIAVDDLIGKVVARLEELKELDHTVIIFTSDNGWFYGQHRLSSKGRPYEEAIRVPLYIASPDIPGGKKIETMVLNTDLAGTILELAGLTADESVDGRSLVPLLQNPTSMNGWRKRVFLEYYRSQFDGDVREHNGFLGVRTSAQDNLPLRLYVEHYDGIQMKDGFYFPDFDTRAGDFVWEWAPVSLEYYDLTEDPYQLNNLMTSQLNPEEAAELSERLAQFLQCAGASCQEVEN